MNIVKKKINLNVQQPNNYQIIHAMQGDNDTIEIEAAIWDGNKKYTIDSDDIISIDCISPSGIQNQIKVLSNTTNTVTFKLDKNVLAENGEHKLSIHFMSNPNISLTTFPAELYVTKAPLGSLAEGVMAIITEYVFAARKSAEKAESFSQSADSSAHNAKVSEDNAKNSETNANASAINAAESAANATQKATAAETSAANAANSATNASASASTATSKASEAAASATNASNLANTAAAKANEASVSAVSASTSAVNAENCANQAKSISEGLAGTLVTGIKGKEESSYRTGNVNITPDNIGAPYGRRKQINTSSFANATPGWIRLTGLMGYNVPSLIMVGKGWNTSRPDGFIISVIPNYNSPPTITQLGAITTSTITKVRCVHKDGSYYVEMYANSTFSSETINVDLLGAGSINIGAGSVPSGYSTTELTLTNTPINSNVSPVVTTAREALYPSVTFNNEMRFGGQNGSNEYLWFNYKLPNGTSSSTKLTAFKFGNGQGSTDGVTLEAGQFKGNLEAPNGVFAINYPYGNVMDIRNTYYGTDIGVGIYSGSDKTSSIAPLKDGMGYCGGSNARWNQVFAKNSTISTSDRREKMEISYIGEDSEYDDTYMSDAQLEKLIMGIKSAVFKRKDGETGRPHHGIISQDFEKLMLEIGLTDHAGFIKSPKSAGIVEEVETEKEIKNDNGESETVIETQKILQQKEIEGEFQYGFRYEELIADIIRFVQILNERYQNLQEEHKSLKERVEKLEEY